MTYYLKCITDLMSFGIAFANSLRGNIYPSDVPSR